MGHIAHFRGGPPISDVEINAYVDGELPPERAEEIRLAARRDTDLSRRIEELRALNAMLRTRHADTSTDRLPGRLDRQLRKWMGQE